MSKDQYRKVMETLTLSEKAKQELERKVKEKAMKRGEAAKKKIFLLTPIFSCCVILIFTAFGIINGIKRKETSKYAVMIPCLVYHNRFYVELSETDIQNNGLTFPITEEQLGVELAKISPCYMIDFQDFYEDFEGKGIFTAKDEIGDSMLIVDSKKGYRYFGFYAFYEEDEVILERTRYPKHKSGLPMNSFFNVFSIFDSSSILKIGTRDLQTKKAGEISEKEDITDFFNQIVDIVGVNSKAYYDKAFGEYFKREDISDEEYCEIDKRSRIGECTLQLFTDKKHSMELIYYPKQSVLKFKEDYFFLTDKANSILLEYVTNSLTTDLVEQPVADKKNMNPFPFIILILVLIFTLCFCPLYTKETKENKEYHALFYTIKKKKI